MARIDSAQLGAIRTLVFAVDATSLTGAARRVGLTPSAVSKQLTRLEDALGARLLERTTRSVRPTAAGLELVRRARPLFDAFEEAATTVRNETSEVRGRVRISASRAFGRVCLLPLIARLAAEHPRLELDVILSPRRLDFIEDGIDLAIREGALDDSTMAARRLGSTEAVLCAAQAYLERRGRPRSLDDLMRHDLLSVPRSGPASDLTRLRGRDGRRLALVPRFQVNDLVALRELAEAGTGIAFLPDYVARASLEQGTLVRVLAKTSIARMPIHAIYPSRRHLPQRVRVVLDALANAGLGLGPEGPSRRARR